MAQPSRDAPPPGDLDFLVREMPAPARDEIEAFRQGGDTIRLERAFASLCDVTCRVGFAVLAAAHPDKRKQAAAAAAQDARKAPKGLLAGISGLCRAIEAVDTCPDGFLGSVLAANSESGGGEDPPVDAAKWVERLVRTFHFWWEYSLGRIDGDDLVLAKPRFARMSLSEVCDAAGFASGDEVMFAERRELIWRVPPSRPAGRASVPPDAVPPPIAVRPGASRKLYGPEEDRLRGMSFLLLESVGDGAGGCDGHSSGSVLRLPPRPVGARVDEPLLINMNGASGVVRLGQRNAIKFLRCPQDPAAREAFDAELNLLREISRGERLKEVRKHCVTYRGFGLARGPDGRSETLFLLTDYVDGSLRTVLDERIKDRGLLTWLLSGETSPRHLAWLAKEYAFAFYVGYRVAHAIWAIRKADLAFSEFQHRDLKPDNLLGCRGGAVRLCDFNSAHEVLGTGIDSSGDGRGNLVARRWRARSALTREYCAPELWDDPLAYDDSNRADVFSLGKILGEMLEFRKEPRLRRACADFEAAFDGVLKPRESETIDGKLDAMLKRDDRPSIGDIRAWTMRCSRAVRTFLWNLCREEIAKAKSDPRPERVQEALQVLAVAFGDQERSQRLQLPACHECGRRKPQVVRDAAKCISSDLGVLRECVEMEDALVLLDRLHDGLSSCPGLFDVFSGAGECLQAHGEFAEANDEWISRPGGLSVAPPAPTCRLAADILEWIAEAAFARGDEGGREHQGVLSRPGSPAEAEAAPA